MKDLVESILDHSDASLILEEARTKLEEEKLLR